MRFMPTALAFALLFAVTPAGHAEVAEDWVECAGGDPAEVIPGCTRIIAAGTEPKSDLAIAYASRGDAFRQIGEIDAAIADFRAALQLDAKNAEARAGLDLLGITR
jgi:tetratricopeptide (TPR) repeat protein